MDHGEGADALPIIEQTNLPDASTNPVVRVLQRLCVTARLQGVTPHVLRHTFASVAGDLGFSELTIAGLLGHAGRGVTQRYIHLDRALVMAADKVAEEIEIALLAEATEEHARRTRQKPVALHMSHLV